MFSNSIKRRSRILGVALAFAVSAAAAHAAPIDLFFNGTVPAPDGNPYGLSTQSQADFLAAGGQALGTRFSLSLLGTQLTVSNPVDITPSYVAGGSDFIANPARDQNDWVFTSNGNLENVWIVFRGHDPTDVLGENSVVGGYRPQNVGLNLDPTGTADFWRMVSLPALGPIPATSYLALFLGDLAQGQSVTKSIHYRVTQDILTNSLGELQFPQHLVGLMFAAAPVPEAGTVLLLVTTGLGLALRRRLV
ncbi:MAG: hypothetical protein JRH01_06995 [Deltaproteobacteria bacterium]|nr:hypothetical protein [Deltaproteobacteria bacterium]MBW2394099.1 hypothetical protein [Deltaproteobacteria bacterium]